MAVQLDADGSGLLLALHAGAAPGEAGHAAGEPVRLRCCRDSATGEAGGGFRWARADGSGSGGSGGGNDDGSSGEAALEALAEELVRLALRLGSADNITVVVVQFEYE